MRWLDRLREARARGDVRFFGTVLDKATRFVVVLIALLVTVTVVVGFIDRGSKLAAQARRQDALVRLSRDQADQLDAIRRDSQKRSEKATSDREELLSQIDSLQTRLAQLTDLLRDAGITVPDDGSPPSTASGGSGGASSPKADRGPGPRTQQGQSHPHAGDNSGNSGGNKPSPKPSPSPSPKPDPAGPLVCVPLLSLCL